MSEKLLIFNIMFFVVVLLLIVLLFARQITGTQKKAEKSLTKVLKAEREEAEKLQTAYLKLEKSQNAGLNLMDDLKEEIAERKKTEKKLKESFLDTIHRLTIVAEYKDAPTTAHIKRVAYYSRFIAGKLGWTKEKQETIFYASPMHDIGKIAIPSNILLKPTKITPEEFVVIKMHTTVGSEILHGSVSEFLQMAERIALTHHERWEGGGYPRGLQGKEIPIEGRIVNIADQYDALRSKRTYKPAFSHERAFKIITEGDGKTMPTHFDPRILKIFKEKHKEFKEIYEKHKN